jgi:hypothetical protein
MTETIQITSPLSGATVKGKITVTAVVTSNVKKVNFSVDGASAGSHSTRPFTVSVDTTKLADGPHTIKATTADGLASATVNVTVANGIPVPPPPPPPSGSCYWGARIDGAFFQKYQGAPNVNDAPWSAGDAAPNNWDRFEHDAGKKVCSVQWGGNDSQGLAFGFDKNAATLAHSRGAFSHYDLGPTKQQLLDLAAGSDANKALTQATTMATAMGALGFPIMFRPMWEMNGNWGYAWQSNSIQPSTYIAAWKQLHAIFAAHAPNVSFFWCPNVADVGDPSPWFPGIGYVDWVGFDGYNQNDASSPAALFGATLAIVKTLAPGLPVGIGETGCEAPTVYAGGKSKWIADFFAFLAAHPEIRWFSWFNEAGNPRLPHIEVGDAATDFGKAAGAAFQAGISDARYVSAPAAGWPSGGKVPIP